MNNDNLKSVAEQNALSALSIDAFRGFDLSNAKNILAQMLNHIGRGDMFSEYTKHDISHVDGMLGILDDIIVEKARNVMTPADWLMLVLSVYFHDIGMIITNEEFENRMNDENFTDYLNSIDKKFCEGLKPENQDKAIYQDYVRNHHGDRVYKWILNVGDTPASESPIDKLLFSILHPLSSQFRKDLAKVCKSHQEKLSDVFENEDADVRYAQDKNSKVNLIYCAAVLRTADLLHVNSERTPDVDFLLISPKNAYSRREWVKQKAVTCIKPKDERDKDGVVDPSKEKHLFEVRAEFSDDDAYSHFNRYLDDADKELLETNKFCRESSRRNNDDYHFPWDGIDRGRIITKNFSAEKLRFELDKDNILKLLIGHTLYSDANVVLRELAQNAIDAGRLMDSKEKESSRFEPRVEIDWNSKDRILKVSDNGVGMDEDVIRNYLFKVGVSCYRSDSFKKENPNFHSISHFGIGILTCFMVSDEIDITTCHYKEKVAHLIKIRNLEGEFILRHDAPLNEILEEKHGTTFKLKLREDAVVDDFEKHLKNWIFIPRCKVVLTIDGNKYEIGYNSIDDAMKSCLSKLGINVDDKSFTIAKYDKEGMSLRILMKKNEYLGNYSFSRDDNLLGEDYAPVGCCVEGIRVVDDTPGYDNRFMMVMIDCVGPNAPSTNVARDRLEEGDSGHNLSDMYRFVYDAYIKEAIKQSKMMNFLISPYTSTRRAALLIDALGPDNGASELSEINLFNDVLSKNKCVYIDNGETCEVMSIAELPLELYTEESHAYSSAINLAAELSESGASPQKIIDTIKGSKEEDKKTVFVDEFFNNHIDELFFNYYQVDKIDVNKNARVISVHWKKGIDNWWHLKNGNSGRYAIKNRFFIQKKDAVVVFPTDGPENIYVTSMGYFVKNMTPIAQYIESIILSKTEYAQRIASVLLSHVGVCIKHNGYKESEFERFFSKDNYYARDYIEKVDKEKFRQALMETKFDKIDFDVFY